MPSKTKKSRPPILLGIAVLLILGVVGAAVYNSSIAKAAPQPYPFDHSAHLDAEIQCVYCHSGAMRGTTAGLPSMNKCMGCHDHIPAEESAALQELAEYAEKGENIVWVPVAIQPDFVYFSHQPHVSAGLNCEKCHGDVGTMTEALSQPHQDMGWCLECHQDLAPEHFTKLSDCATCHK